MDKVMYQIISSQTSKMIKRTNDDGCIWWIPFDDANSDYQAYLAWVAEGNTPQEWTPEG